MPRITDPKLDVKFRALAAVPDVTDSESNGNRWHLSPQRDQFRAIMLLVAGRTLASLVERNSVRLLDDTFIGEGNLDRLRALASHPDVVYVEAPRPASEELVDSVTATKADRNWRVMPNPRTGQNVVIGVVDEGFDF